jgi:hypothetical protein
MWPAINNIIVFVITHYYWCDKRLIELNNVHFLKRLRFLSKEYMIIQTNSPALNFYFKKLGSIVLIVDFKSEISRIHMHQCFTT